MSEVPQPPRSLLVSSVGALNILVAFFGFFTGLFFLVVGPELLPLLGVTLGSPATPPGASAGPPRQFVLWVLFTGAGLGTALLSLVLFVAGVALLLRKAWGRTLTLTFAVLSGSAAVLSLLNQDVLSFSVATMYNLLVFAVLLSPPGAAEFEAPGAAD
jgi:hypothetical protein